MWVLQRRVTHTRSIFTKGRLFIKNSYTEFHENSTNALVAHTTSQTGRSTSVSSHMRSQIFYKRRKVSPHIRRSYPWITNLPTKKKKVQFRLRPPFCVPLLSTPFCASLLRPPFYAPLQFMKQALRHYVFTIISTHSNPVLFKQYFTHPFLQAHITHL